MHPTAASWRYAEAHDQSYDPCIDQLIVMQRTDIIASCGMQLMGFANHGLGAGQDAFIDVWPLPAQSDEGYRAALFRLGQWALAPGRELTDQGKFYRDTCVARGPDAGMPWVVGTVGPSALDYDHGWMKSAFPVVDPFLIHAIKAQEAGDDAERELQALPPTSDPMALADAVRAARADLRLERSRGGSDEGSWAVYSDVDATQYRDEDFHGSDRTDFEVLSRATASSS